MMIDDFEHGVKRRFGDGSDEYSVALQGIKSDRENGIIGNLIRIKRYVITQIVYCLEG